MRFKKLNKSMRFLKWDIFKIFNFDKFKGEEWVLFFTYALSFQRRFIRILNGSWLHDDFIVSKLLTRDKRNRKASKKFYLITRQRAKFFSNILTNSQIRKISKKAFKKSSLCSRPSHQIFSRNICHRLDFILYFSKVCKTPQQARIDIMKGKILINKKRFTHPSYSISTGDIINILPDYKSMLVRQSCIKQLWRWWYFLYDKIHLSYFKETHSYKYFKHFRPYISFINRYSFKLQRSRKRLYKIFFKSSKLLNQLIKISFNKIIFFIKNLKDLLLKKKIHPDYSNIIHYIINTISSFKEINLEHKDEKKLYIYILKNILETTKKIRKQDLEFFSIVKFRVLQTLGKKLRSVIHILKKKTFQKKNSIDFFLHKVFKTLCDNKKFKDLEQKKVQNFFSLIKEFIVQLLPCTNVYTIKNLYFCVCLLSLNEYQYQDLLYFFRKICAIKKKLKNNHTSSFRLVKLMKKATLSYYIKPFPKLNFLRFKESFFYTDIFRKIDFKVLASNGIDSRTLAYWSKNSRLFL